MSHFGLRFDQVFVIIIPIGTTHVLHLVLGTASMIDYKLNYRKVNMTKFRIYIYIYYRLYIIWHPDPFSGQNKQQASND